MAAPGKVLIIVENLPVPFDRRVWQEANTLRDAGYIVSVICPTGKGYELKYEMLNDIHIFRYDLPFEADGVIGYFVEYFISLFYQFILSLKVLRQQGFDVIHACNPPDNIFLIGLFFKLFGKKFIFDHHDINPELYLAKFGRQDIFYKLILSLERWTFRTADISIATNESYKQIAIERGGMDPDKVFVVRSGPDLKRLKIMDPITAMKNGSKYLVGYVGVMGKQEGVDYLLHAAHHMICDLGRKDIHFSLVGGGTELNSLQELAKTLEISEFVTFTGRIPDQQMLEVLNTADVCVNSDVVNEMNDKSTMNKIMEYMALGKPVVQFNLTEGKVSAGRASLYAAPNDAIDLAEKILFLIDHEDIRREMGAYGLQRVRTELAWKFEAPKLLKAYQEVFHPGVRENLSQSA